MQTSLDTVLPWDACDIAVARDDWRGSWLRGHIIEKRNAANEPVAASIRQSIPLDGQATLYAAARLMAPEVTVETGTCNGVSTTALAAGVLEGGGGTLYSIDLPFREGDDLDAFQQQTSTGFKGACIPADEKPGWIVPDEMEGVWCLIEGKSQVQLPRLLSDLYFDGERPGIFLHDSEHSLTCQAMELELAWHAVRPGGLIFCDDAGWTEAFESVADKYSARWAWVAGGMAVMRKSTTDGNR